MIKAIATMAIATSGAFIGQQLLGHIPVANWLAGALTAMACIGIQFIDF